MAPEEWRHRAVVGLLATSSLLLGLEPLAGASCLRAAALNHKAASSASLNASTTPADGRLRGPDFAAKLSEVSWPDQYLFAGKSTEPPPGHRFVVFDLNLSERTSALSPEATQPLVTAAVQWGSSSLALTMNSIDSQIVNGASGTDWATGSASYVATVANTTHDVNLMLTEGSFSQSFNLWSLQRNAPAPTVLYRDPTFPTLSGTSANSTSIALSNPSDGFAATDTLSLQSAALSDFAPSGDAVAPTSPTDAVLSVILDAEHPNNPGDLTGSGHYLGAESSLPGSMVTFTPNGSGAIAATLTKSGDTTGKGNADDGLFDATYSFVVPADVTAGTLKVAADSFTGAEYTLFTPEQGTTTLDVTTPTNLSVSFPAVPAVAVQKTPPWVGAPLPPTAVAGSSVHNLLAPHRGFPIWLAVVLLAVLASVVVAFQRRHVRRHAHAGHAQPGASISTARPSTSEEPQLVDQPEPETPSVLVLGPPVALGLRHVSERRIVEALLSFLTLHPERPLSADQIQLALRPTEGGQPEVARATFHSYLSTLRRCVGPEHLPDAASLGGYQVRDIGSDWADFVRLNDEADGADPARAKVLRAQALGLVRGTPFQDADPEHYAWVGTEHLATTMTVAIATCAITLANEHLGAGDYADAEVAARAGLLGAPDDYELWEIGARALDAAGETTALRRWMADAAVHLDPPDVARIEQALGPHAGSVAQ